MSGPCFMRPYSPHTGHWIKQSDEGRSGNPLAVTDDGELVRPLKPSTIYMFRCVLMFTFSGSGAGGAWSPALSSAPDFVSIMSHRASATNSTDFWNTSSTSDQNNNVMDTAAFTAPRRFLATVAGTKRAYGMIQTSSSGGSFSIQWGGTGVGVTMTLKAGSFIYLKEAVAA